MKVRFAVSPSVEMWDGPALPDLVDALESLGFDTIWLSDVPMGPQVDPLFGLAFAAGRTTRLKLGANLVPIGRNPMLLAKQLAQLDRLSNGRVLLSLVPGLDQPGERGALGIGNADRGAVIDDVIPLLRQWWAGEPVSQVDEDRPVRYDDVRVRPLPVQSPLEIWLGGVGPKALRRAGRLSDGWLGAALAPTEAGAAIATINAAADEAGRSIDAEHFGLSIPFARNAPDDAVLDAMRARRPDIDIADILPVGSAQLRTLVARLVDQGLSKFVVRPATSGTSWREDLDWLADTVLPLQT